MEIIVYSQFDDYRKDELKNEISHVADSKPFMVSDLDTLFDTLRQKMSEQLIIVFLISCVEELDLLIFNQSRLFNSRHILILPDENEDMTSKALSLYPRYLARTNHEFRDVGAVLRKMILIQAGKKTPHHG